MKLRDMIEERKGETKEEQEKLKDLLKILLIGIPEAKKLRAQELMDQSLYHLNKCNEYKLEFMDFVLEDLDEGDQSKEKLEKEGGEDKENPKKMTEGERQAKISAIVAMAKDLNREDIPTLLTIQERECSLVNIFPNTADKSISLNEMTRHVIMQKIFKGNDND